MVDALHLDAAGVRIFDFLENCSRDNRVEGRAFQNRFGFFDAASIDVRQLLRVEPDSAAEIDGLMNFRAGAGIVISRPSAISARSVSSVVRRASRPPAISTHGPAVSRAR